MPAPSCTATKSWTSEPKEELDAHVLLEAAKDDREALCKISNAGSIWAATATTMG
jgi:succinylarginine dihydrolase